MSREDIHIESMALAMVGLAILSVGFANVQVNIRYGERACPGRR